MNTIRSRCQIIGALLSEAAIAEGLQKKLGLSQNEAIKTSRKAHGDFNRALQLHKKNGQDQEYEEWFISWVRSAFKAKNKRRSRICFTGVTPWPERAGKRKRIYRIL